MQNKNEVQKKSKDRLFRHWMIFIVICCLILVFVGYIGSYKVKEYMKSENAEEVIWEECQKKDSYLEYSKYILSYPAGKHNKDALQRMEELKKEEERTPEK